MYSATYENNQIVAEHYSGPGTKEDFLKQTDENKISRIFYHPAPPLKGGHLLGTNTQGADILAYLYGGLQVNMKAAIFYLPIVYFIGITFGMMMGYFGGMFDLGMQRLIEIFSQVPFLFIIMIISDMVPLHMKGMFLIISLLIMFGWMAMTYQLNPLRPHPPQPRRHPGHAGSVQRLRPHSGPGLPGLPGLRPSGHVRQLGAPAQ